MTLRPAGSKPPILIIGGGASGLAAACVCAREGVPFLLLEKEKKPGRKLLATGNGRCNLMNMGPPAYFGDAAFAGSVLKNCGTREVSTFFGSLGLMTFEEEEGRVYPLTRQAASVLDCLLACLASFPGGSVITGCGAEDIRRSETGFTVKTSRGEFGAEKLILACGGPAAPKLGGSDGLVKALLGLGHRAAPFFPALSPLVTEAAPIKGLSGLRVPAILTLLLDGRAALRTAGELFYADYGLSGLCAMQLARDAAVGLTEGRAVSVSVDCSPLMGLAPQYRRRLREDEAVAAPEKVLALLESRRRDLGPERLYTGLLPSKMADRLAGLTIKQAAAWLCGLTLPVLGVMGFEQAQVAAGGLSCDDFSPETMESRVAPGLYACGEILGVDGDTGGFNLLFAWATGILAAKGAAAGGRKA